MFVRRPKTCWCSHRKLEVSIFPWIANGFKHASVTTWCSRRDSYWNLGIQNESTITIIYSTVDMVLFHRKFTTKWSFFYIILDVILRTRVLVLKVFQRSFETILWPFESKQNEGNDPDKSKSYLHCYDVLSFLLPFRKILHHNQQEN